MTSRSISTLAAFAGGLLLATACGAPEDPGPGQLDISGFDAVSTFVPDSRSGGNWTLDGVEDADGNVGRFRMSALRDYDANNEAFVSYVGAEFEVDSVILFAWGADNQQGLVNVQGGVPGALYQADDSGSLFPVDAIDFNGATLVGDSGNLTLNGSLNW